MRIGIDMYLELRSAGYTQDEITAYFSTKEQPKAQEVIEQPKATEVIEQHKAPEVIEPLLELTEQPKAQEMPPNTEILMQILNAVQGGNIQKAAMVENERTVENILAEIVNPNGEKIN